MKIKTDGDVMRIANRIDDLGAEVSALIHAIEESEHPNAAALADDLWNQCWFASWANHVTTDYLEHPEQWDCDKTEDGTHLRYYHKAARKAHRTRLKVKYKKSIQRKE